MSTETLITQNEEDAKEQTEQEEKVTFAALLSHLSAITDQNNESVNELFNSIAGISPDSLPQEETATESAGMLGECVNIVHKQINIRDKLNELKKIIS